MSTTRRGPGHEHDQSILASSRPEPAGQSSCGPTIATDGSGLSGISRDGGDQLITNARSRAGTGRAPGSVLIAVAAWLLALIGGGALFVSFSAQYAYIFTVRRQDAASVIEALLLDLLMIVFTLLALGLSRAGKSARAERILILACAAASSYMNVAAADVASPRSVAAYAIAPVALAVVVDRVVAVIRRHVLADREPSAWSTVGRAAVAAARIAGLVLLYCLRLALAAPETARGLRRMVLDAAPLPALPEVRRAGGYRPAPHQEGGPAHLVPRPSGLRGPPHGQPGRCRTCPAGGAAGRHRPQLRVRGAGPQGVMTADPPAEPSPRALGESLAALAAQLADLRGEIRAINERLDQAGLRADLNLADRFEDLAQTVADALDAAAPRGPAAPYWIGLDRDTYHARLVDLQRWADTVLCQHYGGYELRDCWPRHIHAVWELSTLAAEWHRTYSGSRPDLARALEFYDRWLPNTMRRIAGMTRACMTQCVMLRRPGDTVYVQRR